jgi:7-carboxy-7-deazaguanine synthase
MNLNLIEIFRSVQGETNLSGLPTTFIRLAACNLRCSWCDTTYSFGRGEPFTLDHIISRVEENGCRHVCVTGGEPLLQENVFPLMDRLCAKGYVVSLETGGSLPIAKVNPQVITILDVKCPGSKMHEKNHWPNMEILRSHDQVKFVIMDEADYLYAKDVCDKHNLYERVSEVLFSPVFGVMDSQQLVQWILEDKLRVRLNLQLHKFIWTPETKGV